MTEEDRYQIIFVAWRHVPAVGVVRIEDESVDVDGETYNAMMKLLKRE